MYNGTNWNPATVPAGLSSVIAIAGGGDHNLALKGDGTVVAWGYNYSGQCNVPAGLSNVIALAGGGYHSLALKNDGTVVAWGWNQYGQCSVPAGLNHVASISAGNLHSLALKNDGTVVAWSTTGIQNTNGPAYDFGQCAVPPSLKNVSAISARGYRSVALVTYPPLAITKTPPSQTAYQGNNVTFTVQTTGYPPPYYFLFTSGMNLVSFGTSPSLLVTNVQYWLSGVYFVVVTNYFGAVTSAPVMLNVIAPVEQRLVPALILAAQPASILFLDVSSAFNPGQAWTLLDSVYLTNSPQFYFDLTTPLQPQRYYRVWQSGVLPVRPSVSLPALVPAITLYSNVGGPLRVDGINQYGPTGAWFTIDTVTLSSPSQLYFDTASIGQPQRLYRIVPVP
jgi:hypothetical protein